MYFTHSEALGSEKKSSADVTLVTTFKIIIGIKKKKKSLKIWKYQFDFFF